MSGPKIRIQDDPSLRSVLEEECGKASKGKACRCALQLAKHTLEAAGYPVEESKTVKEAFRVCENYMKGEASMKDLRSAAFSVHELARSQSDEVMRAALRAAGHAAAAGHVKQHALVASDYAVKAVNLIHPGSMDEAVKERLWQIDMLKKTED